MKRNEKNAARKLRKRGYSIGQICRELGVAKSSVSVWVRDIVLSETQKKNLSDKGRSVASVEARRASRLANERAKRDGVFNAAKESVQSLTIRDIQMIGLGLYWGEGSKTERGTAGFYNADPRVNQVMLKFYTEVCGVPLERIRLRVYLHPHLSATKAVKYWASILGVSKNHFSKTTMQVSKASKGKKDSLPYGTLSMCVYDTSLYLRIMGQLESVYEKCVSKHESRVSCRYESFR